MVHLNPIAKNKKQGGSSFAKNSLSDKDLAACFVGSMLKRGNKQRAIRFFQFLIYSVQRTYGMDGLKFIRILLESIRPKVFLSSKKIAGIVHKIPTPVSTAKSYSIAIHWLISSASKKNSSKRFFYNLFDEVNDVYRNPLNPTLKKRDEFHRIAYINKPFLRFYKL